MNRTKSHLQEEAAIKNPKVVLIGAGSLFFGRQAIWQMVHSPFLNKGTLALVDTDSKTLDRMTTLAKMVVKDQKVDLKIESSMKAEDVLKGADFVVLSFAKDSVKYRVKDCEIAAKYGIRMCSGDTIGPGGVFRAMRELPVIMRYAQQIEDICPDAWVINYINPTAVHGMALRRFAPNLKSFALCDGLHMPHIKKEYALRSGIIKDKKDYNEEIDKDFNFKIAGVNHFTWLLKADYKNQDMTGEIAKELGLKAAKETDGGDVGAKAKFNASISSELYNAFGYASTCIGHTKEYVRFYQGNNVADERLPELELWDYEARIERHANMWKQVDGYINGDVPISNYMTEVGPDHATDIIENMVGNLGKQFFINTYNEGAVTNMADDAFIELLCDVNMDGPKPLAVGEMPRGLRGLQEQVLDTHELTAEAVITQNKSLLRTALLVDPLSNSYADVDAIIEELLEAEKDIIPKEWYS